MSTYETAIDLHKKGQYAEAEAIYRKLLDTEPTNIDFLHLLSIVLAQQEKIKEALPHIKEAIKNDSNNPTLYNSLGNIYKRLKLVKKSKKAYLDALSLNPSNATTLNNLAILSYQEENYDEAILHYQAALRLDSNYVDAHYNLGLCFIKTKDKTKAIQHFEKTISLSSEYEDAHYQLGILYLENHAYDHAIASFKKQLNTTPEHIETLNNLGAAFMKTGEFEKAAEYLRNVMTLDKEHTEALHNLGMTYIKLNQTEHAIRCYTQLLPIDPGYIVYFNLGTLHLDLDHYTDSLEFFNQALKIKPNDADTYHNMALCYQRQNKNNEAIEYYKKAININPENTVALYTLAGLENKQTYDKAPNIFVQRLFDNYAPHFDNHLTEYLQYKAPDQLFEVVKNNINQDNLTILDLGCGSGLCGEKFKPIAKTITGVDLSEKMIRNARYKKIYDELHVNDIETYLKTCSAYDLIIAGDVFTYIGNLDTIFKFAFNALNTMGALAFTTEKLNDPTNNYYLQTNMRFSHEKRYIEYLASQHKFTVEARHNAQLRTEKGKPTEGYVYLLTKKISGGSLA